MKFQKADDFDSIVASVIEEAKTIYIQRNFGQLCIKENDCGDINITAEYSDHVRKEMRNVVQTAFSDIQKDLQLLNKIAGSSKHDGKMQKQPEQTNRPQQMPPPYQGPMNK